MWTWRVRQERVVTRDQVHWRISKELGGKYSSLQGTPPDTLTTNYSPLQLSSLITVEWLDSNMPPYPDPERKKAFAWLVDCWVLPSIRSRNRIKSLGLAKERFSVLNIRGSPNLILMTINFCLTEQESKWRQDQTSKICSKSHRWTHRGKLRGTTQDKRLDIFCFKCMQVIRHIF